MIFCCRSLSWVYGTGLRQSAMLLAIAVSAQSFAHRNREPLTMNISSKTMDERRIGQLDPTQACRRGTRGPEAGDQRDFGQQALATTVVTLMPASMSVISTRSLGPCKAGWLDLQAWWHSTRCLLPGQACDRQHARCSAPAASESTQICEGSRTRSAITVPSAGRRPDRTL
jgi:hypothetical protein